MYSPEWGYMFIFRLGDFSAMDAFYAYALYGTKRLSNDGLWFANNSELKE